MNQRDNALYTAKVVTTGGREGGPGRSFDRSLDVRMSPPSNRMSGTNLEQLFAAGWSACFEHAIGIAARKKQVPLPSHFVIDTAFDLSLVDGFHTISARLNVSLPEISRDVAQALVDEAHTLCPYSRTIRGNISITTTLV